MNIINIKRRNKLFVIIFIILAFLSCTNVIYADPETPEGGLPKKEGTVRTGAVEDWLKSDNFQIQRQEYRDNDIDLYGYAIVLPPLTKDFSYIPGVGLVQKQYDGNGNYVGDKVIEKFTITVKVAGNESIPIEVSTVTDIVKTDEGLKVVFATNKTKTEAGATYRDASNTEIHLDGHTIKLANGQEVSGPNITVESLSSARIESVTINSSTVNINPGNTKYKDNNISIWSRIGSWFSGIVESVKEWAIDKISGIFNALLLPLGDGIHSLIVGAYGGEVSIEKIVYNQDEKLGINFWNKTEGTGATGVLGSFGNALKTVVNVWYNFFSSIAIAFMLVMFLYNAIRILLSSTGKGLEDAKQRLIAWTMGVAILFLFPYVMKYVVILNEALVQIVATEGSELEDTSADIMQIIRALAGPDGLLPNKEHVKDANGKDVDIKGLNSLPLTIAYIILNGQLVMLLIIYYRRAFIVAFLITMFPIICAYNLWEKIHSGKRRIT